MLPPLLLLLLATALLLTLTLFTLTAFGPTPPAGRLVGLLVVEDSLFLFLFEPFLCDRRLGVLARIGAAAVVISRVALRAVGGSVEPDDPYEALVETVEPRDGVEVTSGVVVPPVVVDELLVATSALVLVSAAAFGRLVEDEVMSRFDSTSSGVAAAETDVPDVGAFDVVVEVMGVELEELVLVVAVLVLEVVVLLLLLVLAVDVDDEGTEVEVEVLGFSVISPRNASGSSLSVTSRFRRQLLPKVCACRSLIS